MRGGGGAAEPAAAADAEREELAVKTARKDGRQVATIRAVQVGLECSVQCEVYPVSGLVVDPLNPGPYTFATPAEATAFVEEAGKALTYLGCEVS
jgi:hypothetical protein